MDSEHEQEDSDPCPSYQGKYQQQERDRACQAPGRVAEVAEADRPLVPAHEMEEVQQGECLPRGHQGGGSEGEDWLDEDPHQEEDQRVKRKKRKGSKRKGKSPLLFGYFLLGPAKCDCKV